MGQKNCFTKGVLDPVFDQNCITIYIKILKKNLYVSTKTKQNSGFPHCVDF